MSVIPLLSLASVFPVQGAIIRISSILFGPNFSASAIVTTDLFWVVSSTNLTKSLALPKRQSVV